MKKWALDYFGPRKSGTDQDNRMIDSVAQKYFDQQSALLTWNGLWGKFSEDPLLLEVWPYVEVVAMARGTLLFQSAQVFVKVEPCSRSWLR